MFNPTHHQYHQVGDEPLLLAKHAPTWVSRNRRAAVPLAIQSGADILLLDDAHQNYTIKKDLNFVVVNGSQGFGNGRVFPAGPLRQPIKVGLEYTTAIIYISQKNDHIPEVLRSNQCPIICASIVPLDLKPCTVVAFAGIGYPEKFRQTLIDAGYEVKAFIPFPDHYPYTEEDLRKLHAKARIEHATLITTEKDAMRLPPANKKGIIILSMNITFYSTTALQSLLKDNLKG